MIKNYLKVQADEFRVLKKEIEKQQKDIDIQRQMFDEDVTKFKT
jgi:phosphatidylserine/phosphatidylglycerophosphate/cardiolipin synthase-like enzyme